MVGIKGAGPVLLSYFLWVAFKHPQKHPDAKKQPSIPHVVHNVERRQIVPELVVDGQGQR
jgi:hypothetical protein